MKKKLDPSLIMDQVTEEIARHRSPTEVPNLDQRLQEMPFSQAALLYNELRINDGARLSPQTIANDNVGINTILAAVGDLPLPEMRHSAVYDEIRRQHAIAPSARNFALIFASKMTNYFLRRGMIGWKADVGPHLTVYGAPKFVPSVEELGALEKSLMRLHPRKTKTKSKMMHYSLRLALVLQYFCGFRRGAIESLTWDVIYPRKLVTVVPKTGRVHQIPMHPIMTRYLDTYVQSVEWDGPPKVPNTEILNLMRTHPHADIADEVRNKRIFRFTGAQLNHWYTKASKHANLSGVVNTHAVRRASITQWTIADPTCGRIIHGTGVPAIVKAYWCEEAILRRSMHRLAYPESWLSPAQRREMVIERLEWNAAYEGLDSEERQAILTVVRSMLGEDRRNA